MFFLLLVFVCHIVRYFYFVELFLFFFVFCCFFFFFFFSSRRRHTRSLCDWSSDVCSSDLIVAAVMTDIPFSYISLAKTWMASAMMKTDGFLHLLGSMPSDPIPRVTTARM